VGLIPQALDVIVDVVDALAQLRKVVDLAEMGTTIKTRGMPATSDNPSAHLQAGGTHAPRYCWGDNPLPIPPHLLTDGQLQALCLQPLLQALEVLMKVLLAPGGVGHKVPLQPQEDHGLLADTEEDVLLQRGGEVA